jgi:membrane protease YdiL (CAAX protease family)
MRNVKSAKLFINTLGELRNGWWMLIFFAVLIAILLPVLLLAQQRGMDVSIGQQALIIALVSIFCEILRRRNLHHLLGRLNTRWVVELGVGGAIGSLLMLVPALILSVCGWLTWQVNPSGFSALAASAVLFAQVAIAEELLFRGFLFQRLTAGLGPWPAQLVTAGFFLLTHLNNPGLAGAGIFASLNIFLASLLFGLAYLRTKSLAMSLGLHFMANLVQGGLLGNGVSGTDQAGLLIPNLAGVPEWLTGGRFGFEASIFGLAAVITAIVLLSWWRMPSASD